MIQLFENNKSLIHFDSNNFAIFRGEPNQSTNPKVSKYPATSIEGYYGSVETALKQCGNNAEALKALKGYQNLLSIIKSNYGDARHIRQYNNDGKNKIRIQLPKNYYLTKIDEGNIGLFKGHGNTAVAYYQRIDKALMGSANLLIKRKPLLNTVEGLSHRIAEIHLAVNSIDVDIEAFMKGDS